MHLALSSPVCSPRTAPIARGSNTISYEEPASGAPSPRRRERAKAHGNRSRGDHIAQPPACCARASRAPDGQHPRPARAPPGGGTVWRAPRARRTLLTVLNLFIARPRVRRSRPASRAQRPARTRTPPRVRPPTRSDTAARRQHAVVRRARPAPVARGAAARRSPDAAGVAPRARARAPWPYSAWVAGPPPRPRERG